MSLTDLVPLPYRIAAVALVIVAAGATGFIKGITYDSSRHTSEMVAIQKKADAQELRTAKIIQMQNNISNETVNDYTNRIADIDARYSRLLHNSRSSQVPKNAGTTQGVNESSAYLTLAHECTKTTEQLVALQNWLLLVEGVQ